MDHLPDSFRSALDRALRRLAGFLVGPDYYDARVQAWPLADVQSALMVSALYVLGVPLGQWLMRGRKPFRVKAVSVLHNIFMFLLSLWMTVETLSQAHENFGWRKHFVPFANMTEKGSSFSPSGYRLARVIWVHYISKAYEFMDTLIMILRRKDQQVSFLHVYHHASTFFPSWWSALNFAPGGDVYFICALNSFVHVCMYAYYLVSSLGLRCPQALKKSITVLQMVQFGLLNAQAFYGVFWATHYRPRVVVVLAIVQSVVFMALFANFYRKAYGRRARAQNPIAGASVQVRLAEQAAQKAAGSVAGAPALISKGPSKPAQRGKRPNEQTNGQH